MLANFCVCPECFRLLLTLVVEYGTDRTDCALSLSGRFDNAEADFLLEQTVKAFTSGRSGKRSRDEYLYAVCHSDHAALDNFCNNAFHDCFFFFRLHDLVPALLCVKKSLGQLDRSLLVVRLHDDKVELVAHLYKILDFCVRIARELGKLYNTCLFSADIYINLCGSYANNRARYSAICIIIFGRLFKELLKIFLGFTFLSIFDFICHGNKYLLYNACRCGCTCCNADPMRRRYRFKRQLTRRFDQKRCIAFFLTDLPELIRVGAVTSANHKHQI